MDESMATTLEQHELTISVDEQLNMEVESKQGTEYDLDLPNMYPFLLSPK